MLGPPLGRDESRQARPLNLLVVQRESPQADLVRDVFGGRGDFHLLSQPDLKAARRAIQMSAPAVDVVLADLDLPDGVATDLLDGQSLPLALLADVDDTAAAVRAIKNGAFDYLVKSPETFSRLPELVTRVHREWTQQQARVATLRELEHKTAALQDMNRRLQSLLQLAQRVMVAAGGDECLELFWRQLSHEFDVPRPVTWETWVSERNEDADLRHAAESARREQVIVVHEVEPEAGRRHCLLLPVARCGGQPELLVLERAERFSEADQAIAQLSLSFLNAALSSQAAANELRESQERLNQSERMKSIGQLAGGVAHDFNNMLMVMSAAAEVMGDKLPRDHECAAHLQLIVNTSHRAAELTQKLLAFSRKRRLAKRVMDVNEVLVTVCEFLSHALGPRISLKRSLCPGPFLIDADGTQLQNVLLNICLNARDAMPDGGVLHVSSEVRELSETEVRVRVPEGRPGPYVCIQVEDTGTGMDSGTLKHAFDPFFTTKEPGRGTGLGLSVVFGSVREHGGSVRLDSAVGRGTRCTLLLPSSGGALVEGATEAPIRVVQRGLRVMLVDDDPAVCRTTAQLMRQLGYKVQALHSGQRALLHLLGHSASYDLLMLDVTMPDPSGIDVYRELAAADIRLPTVFVSGYGAEALLEELSARRDVVSLRKPFRQRELAAAIARCVSTGDSELPPAPSDVD